MPVVRESALSFGVKLTISKSRQTLAQSAHCRFWLVGRQEDEVGNVVVERGAAVQRRGHFWPLVGRLQPSNREVFDLMQLAAMDVIAPISELTEKRRDAR